MSCDIDSDSFHGRRVVRVIGTKKGDRRKTVSSRRAYVNTPSVIRKKLAEIQVLLLSVRNSQKVFGNDLVDIKQAISLINKLYKEL